MAQQCEERVFSGARTDIRGHRCSFRAVAQENGKWVCKRHTQAEKKKRDKEWERKYREWKDALDLKLAEESEQKRRAEIFPELLEALKGLMEAFGGVENHAQQAKWDVAMAAIAKAEGRER